MPQKINQEIQKLHKTFRQYGGNARLWMRKCVLMLPDIERKRVWEKKGFSSIYEYAAKLAGMSRSSVDDALWIIRKLDNKPALREVAERKGLNSVRPVISVATKETDQFWADKAKVMSRQTLATFVRENKKQNGFPKGKKESCFRTGPKIVTMELEPEVLQELEKLKGNKDWNSIIKQLLEERKAAIKRDKPQAVKTKSRHIPVAIKRYVLKKTNGQCAFPGCSKRAKILHHTQRFALNREHNPEKIAPLCPAHENIAHLGLIENEERSPQKWHLRPDADRTNVKFYIDSQVAEYRCGSP